MKQVPDSLLAFQHMFPDDDACAAWLIEMRWPDGFVCPACGHEKGLCCKPDVGVSQIRTTVVSRIRSIEVQGFLSH